MWDSCERGIVPEAPLFYLSNFDIKFLVQYIYLGATTKRQDGCSPPESTSSVRSDDRNLLNLFYQESGKGGLLQLITISIETIYYALAIASILCGAAYKLGYELGKNAKK